MAGKLPHEVWLEILDGLGQDDVAAVSLVSQNLHILIEPLLYSKYCWVSDIKYGIILIPKRFRSSGVSPNKSLEDHRGGFGQRSRTATTSYSSISAFSSELTAPGLACEESAFYGTFNSYWGR